MPKTTVVFYKEADGSVPVLDWLDELRSRDASAYLVCEKMIDNLKEYGHELRRPQADILRDGIYELRGKKGHVQFRLLYFFNGKDFTVLSHSLIKKSSAVDGNAIDLSVRRKAAFASNPQKHSQYRDIPNATNI